MLETQLSQAATEWASVVDLPFDNFEQLKAAVAIRSFNIGVDSLAAAEWAQRSNTRFKKAIISALSLLLIAAAIASVVLALWTHEYWLLAAAPIQAATFYVSQPSSPVHKWVTVAGAVSVALFLDLMLNHLPIAAALVAYAGLTFAAVRAAGYITNSAFRKALLADEGLFVEAFNERACTVRNNQTKRVYSA